MRLHVVGQLSGSGFRLSNEQSPRGEGHSQLLVGLGVLEYLPGVLEWHAWPVIGSEEGLSVEVSE